MFPPLTVAQHRFYCLVFLCLASVHVLRACGSGLHFTGSCIFPCLLHWFLIFPRLESFACFQVLISSFRYFFLLGGWGVWGGSFMSVIKNAVKAKAIPNINSGLGSFFVSASLSILALGSVASESSFPLLFLTTANAVTSTIRDCQYITEIIHLTELPNESFSKRFSFTYCCLFLAVTFLTKKTS